MAVVGTAEAPRSLRVPVQPVMRHLTGNARPKTWTTYSDTVRRKYFELLELSGQMGTTASSECRDLVADLVHHLAWCDGDLTHAEMSALNHLVDADREREGDLVSRLHVAPAEMNGLPEFLSRCLRHDASHGTRLFGTAINLLESIGFSLLASDRVIHPEELANLKSRVHSWRVAGRKG